MKFLKYTYISFEQENYLNLEYSTIAGIALHNGTNLGAYDLPNKILSNQINKNVKMTSQEVIANNSSVSPSQALLLDTASAILFEKNNPTASLIIASAAYIFANSENQRIETDIVFLNNMALKEGIELSPEDFIDNENSLPEVTLPNLEKIVYSISALNQVKSKTMNRKL